MKKKLFLGALLLGALTLNSCVDNVESDSVKSVRQAKAEQLKAKADYDKALGEAAVISANAEKAAQEALADYQKAQAEYEKAKAEYEKAQAAYWNAKAESEQAAAAQAAEQAAIDLEMAKLQLANYEKMIASLEAKWEEQLYKNQQAALEAKIDLEKAIKKGDQAKIDELETLLTNYTTASDKLIQAQKDLAKDKLTLAKYEAGLITTTEVIVDQLKQLYEDKNNYEIELNAYEAALEIFEKNYSYEAAKEALVTAYQEYADLKIVKAKATSAKDDAAAVAVSAEFALTSSKYADAVKYITAIVTNGGYVFDSSYPGLKVINATNPSLGIGNVGNYCAQITDNSGTTYIPLFSNEYTPLSKDLTYLEYGNTIPTNTPAFYKEYTKYYNLVDGGMPQFVDAVKAFVKKNQEKALTDATKEVTDQTAIVNPIKALCDKLEPLGKAYTDAEAARSADTTGDPDGILARAETDTYNAFKAAVADQKLVAPNFLPTISLTSPQKLDDFLAANTVSQTVDLCKDAYNYEKNELDVLVSAENRAKYVLTQAEKTVAEIETIAKTLVDGNKDNLAAIAEVNKTQLAKAETYLAFIKAKNDVDVKYAEIVAINATVSGTTTVTINGDTFNYTAQQLKEHIKTTTDLIAKKQDEIDAKEKELASGKLDEQQTIEDLKLDIADQELQIPVLEQKVKLAKELLDAAMKSEDAETPAE